MFSGFVTIGRYGKWFLADINLHLILVCQMAALVRRALMEGMHCPSASRLLL